MHQSETDMIDRIFTATNDLMATVGLPNLSIHKIAKEAKISPGTIYLYFKKSALNIAFKCKHFAHKSSMAMLESVIDRTWRAIQK